jgi:putative transposase
LYRNLGAKKYDGSAARRPGRPPTKTDIAKLVIQMATANRGWGYTRVRGALWNLGHELGRNTIKRIMTDAGIEPAPDRSKRTTWKTFLKAHWGAIAAMDFFTVEVLTWRGLVRYFVLFAIDLKTRRVHIAGIVHEAYGLWMEQVARNLTDPVEGFLRDTRYLIHDRDPLFTRRSVEILEAAGVKSVKLPARSPNLNAYAERLVLSARRECLNKVIPFTIRGAADFQASHRHADKSTRDSRDSAAERRAGHNNKGPTAIRQQAFELLESQLD